MEKEDFTVKYRDMFPDLRDTVDSDLEKCQLIMLRLLRIFDDICRRHGLSYWLGGGTLLGAARHKGFIPWDDDLDVSMPRADYERFFKIGLAELPEDIFLQHMDTEDRYMYFMRLRDNYSTYREEKNVSGVHNGIRLDIFPFDHYRIPEKLIFPLSKALTAVLLDEFSIGKYNTRKKFKTLRKLRYAAARMPSFFLSARARKKIFASISALVTTEDTKGPFFVGLEGCQRKYRRVDPTDVFPLTEIMFEGYSFMAPRNVPKYLTDLYGDYNEIPDITERMIHSSVISPYESCGHPRSLHWQDKRKEQ